MRRTWKDNADEFALLDTGEGWPFARLVACSVERGAGNGVNKTGQHAPKAVARATASGKVSAREFAERAKTSADRVLRYLDAWDKAAKKGLVTHSGDLVPADAATTMEPDVAWATLYKPISGGRPRDSKPEDAVTIIARRGADAVVAEMTEEQRREVAQAAIHAGDAETRALARGAINTHAEEDFQSVFPGGLKKVDLSGELGFDPDMVLEANRLARLLGEYHRRVSKLMDTCQGEADLTWVRGLLLPEAEAIVSTLVPVPDTIAGLER